MNNQITRLPDYSVTKFLLVLTFLAAASAVLAGCGTRTPPAPYSLAFAADGSTPRILRTGEEIVVPLTVRNTGQRGWDSARIHVSYHWLWFVPRELAKRSRTVPFHDGIRSEIGAAVPPGGEVHVGGRLLAPNYPGLYWLQWDMVEEGVTWFAQVSPRQSRRFVLVLPTLAGFFAPWPAGVALLGAIALIRRRRPRSPVVLAAMAGADVIWSATALFSKPLILVHEALLEPTPAAYWLIVVAAVAPPLLAMALLPRHARAWVLLAHGIFATLLILGDALYYRFFGDVLSASAMLAVRQTWRVSGSIHSLVTPEMVWLVVDIPLALWLTVAITRSSPPAAPSRRPRLLAAAALALIAIAGVLTLTPAFRAGRFDQVFRDRAVMEQLGPFGYHAYDTWLYASSTLFRPPASPAQIAETRRWFAERARLRAGVGPSFGAAAGRNLIVIQVESLQDFAVDHTVNGQPVMPHLRQWSRDALRFSHVTDETNEGRTSDAEFAALTSLLPLDHGAAAFRYPGDHYVGFPRVLSERGYATLSAVPFEAGFWNRRVMHPSYGFQESLFEPDFTLTEQIGWGLNDHDFLQQMVPRLERMRRPFAAWLITLSLHHPFEDFPDTHKVLSLGPLEHTSFGNYLHTMRFFDTALDAFQTSLARAGVLDDTMLVVFGDHDAGFGREDALAGTIGIGADEASWELNDRVPFFIRLPHAPPPLTGTRTIAAGQTDFAPTVLALLGIDPAPLPYIGRNLLGEPGDPPIVRPYGDWIDGSHLFISRSAAEGGAGCYGTTVAAWVDPSGCRRANESAGRTREIARLVVTGHLQQRLREALR